MKMVEQNESGFVVEADLLAQAFRLPAASVPALMRQGDITSRCETGVDGDAGTFRLTFFHAGRAFRVTVDAAGTILKRTSFDVPSRS